MRLATFLLALVMGLGTLGLGTSAAEAQSVKAPTTTVAMTVAPAGLGTLRPGDDLMLTASISNPTTHNVLAGTASVYLDRAAVTSRAALAGWLNNTADADGPHVTTEVFQSPSPEIPAGATRTLYLIVPAASIGLSSTTATWGPRAIRVRLASGSTEVASANSTFVWYPGGALQATKLSLVAPIGAPPSTAGLMARAQLATMTAPGGLLTHELDEALDRQVALAIDPQVIASIRILGTSAPHSVLDWLARLMSATNDSFALSYADSDISAMSQSAGHSLLTSTDFTIDPDLYPTPTPTPSTPPTPGSIKDPEPSASPHATVPVLPTSETILDWEYTLEGLAWPLDNSVVQADLDTFAKAGLTTTILASTNVAYRDTARTPNAAATVDGHHALVADDAISQLFRTAVLAPTTVAWQSALAELSASIAMVTRQNAHSASSLVATLGRNYPTSNYRLSDTLDALRTAPWIAPSSLSSALAANPASASIVNRPEAASRITQTDALVSAESSVGVFSSVLQEPVLLTGPHRLDLLATLANGWATDKTGWKTAYTAYISGSTKITNSVTIVASSSIIQLSDKISLPVTVRNDLPYPVDVVISVRSPSGILQVKKNLVPLTIEEKSQAGARIPVQSVANGDVELQVSLSSKTGVPIAVPSYIDVDVQAQWETAITVAIAALLFLVFGFGIWRNIVRRRKSRSELAPESATPPEEHAASSQND